MLLNANRYLVDPDRYINHDLSASEYANHPDPELRDHYAFGGGRRICPGLHVAEKSLCLNLARLLWEFNLDIARDERGEIILIDFTLNGLMPGVLSNPKPYQCCMFPFPLEVPGGDRFFEMGAEGSDYG